MSSQETKRILVPVDGSDNSFRAATPAINMAKKYGAELLLVHVSNLNQNIQLLGIYGVPYPDAIAKHIEAAKLEAQPWFERIRKEAEHAGVQVKSQEVIEGPLSIVGEIINYAESNKVDLIIIGSRGRTGFKRLLLGSVASGVVTYAPCPVLVVK